MNCRILVVDDEPGAGQPLRALLGEAGYESVWIERAEEALRLLDGGAFDLVLTEIDLEGMDGIELCRHVSAAPSGPPVIVLTGTPSLEVAVESFRAGAADFVGKGEFREAILDALARALGRPSAAGRRADEPADSSPRRIDGNAPALYSMDEVEREHVTRVLEAVGGNKREAARILKLDRTTLYRKLKRYGIPSVRRSGTRG